VHRPLLAASIDDADLAAPVDGVEDRQIVDARHREARRDVGVVQSLVDDVSAVALVHLASAVVV
jgi:hypothetical protein